jgi:hypothetical protein
LVEDSADPRPHPGDSDPDDSRQRFRFLIRDHHSRFGAVLMAINIQIIENAQRVDAS